MNTLIDLAKRDNKSIKIANLIYSPVTKSFYAGNEMVKLEPRLSELIELLISNLNNPISNNEIMKVIWGNEYISRNVVTNKVGELRSVIKQLSLDMEANEIIITYPKKGYYIPDNLVSLVDDDTVDRKEPESKDKSIVSSNKRDNKNRVLLGMFFSILIFLAVFLFISSHYEKIKSKNDVDSLYIPQTKLRINKINCKNQEAINYLIPLKSMILRVLASNNSIELTNLRSPDYFLQKIDRTCLWPGSQNRDAEYTLSFNFWLGEGEDVNLEALLYYSPSNKVAWRKLYSSPISSLENIAIDFYSDIVRYLKLPMHSITPQDIDMKNIEDIKNADGSLLIERELSLSEVYFISREFFLRNTDFSLIERWISILKVRYPTPEPELHIWLSLLTYKIGKAELSLEMLNREYVYEFPDNALINLLKANISFSQGNYERYLSEYLLTMSSLSLTYHSDAIFQHFEQGSEPQTCELIWDSVFSGESLKMNETITSNIKSFCNGVEQLSKSKSLWAN